ncbi:unnamed protein product [Peronospora farinosa]|uniref:Seipin n=1 Tax=Peronospora farinosa TaxID=134698 RepID=A0AAV0V0P0_9STRA|nr:unnamed protein product [Peronospora farinosa]CAI5740394.1 unnamed protein product [Peronospora farinosa]
MASWVPWTLLLAFLPSSATELLKDEVERQRLRVELARLARDYLKLLLLWSLRVAQVFAGISFLVVSASMLYALFYFLVIPSRYHEQDVFFNYGPRHGAITQPSDYPFIPTASLDLRDPVHQWQSLVPVSKPTTSPVLVPGVKYDVILELTVPESRVNAEVGVFMVSTSLWEAKNKRQLAASARPVMLHDLPMPVRWLRLGFWLVPYALGFTEPVQTLRVTAVNGYLEHIEYPLTRVDIELNTPMLQVYSAKLTVIAQLTGVRYLMYHWAVPTAILFILNIVFLEALVLVILYAVYVLPELDEEASADVIALEAAATDARDKAKKVFETGTPLDDETIPHVKNETLIGEASFTTTGMAESSAALDDVIEAVIEDAKEEAMDVKKEQAGDSP